jgi:hypothetical protein
MTREAKSAHSKSGLAKTALEAANDMLTSNSSFSLYREVTLKPEEIDAFVKERIRIYVQTWLLPPLRELNEKLK